MSEQRSTPRDDGFSMPAEWEPPEARRRFAAVHGTYLATRGSLVRNTAVPPIRVDLADGTVTLEGRILAVDPVSGVP